MLRRATQLSERRVSDNATISIDGLVIDPVKRTVMVDGAAAELTYVEFEVLRTLATHPGRVYSRNALLEAVWGGSAYREPRTIDVHIRHLREKLESDPGEPSFILTVRGAGYRFRDTATAAVPP
jgi:DNA-binding response OmpR family regulator